MSTTNDSIETEEASDTQAEKQSTKTAEGADYTETVAYWLGDKNPVESIWLTIMLGINLAFATSVMLLGKHVSQTLHISEDVFYFLARVFSCYFTFVVKSHIEWLDVTVQLLATTHIIMTIFYFLACGAW